MTSGIIALDGPSIASAARARARTEARRPFDPIHRLAEQPRASRGIAGVLVLAAHQRTVIVDADGPAGRLQMDADLARNHRR